MSIQSHDTEKPASQCLGRVTPVLVGQCVTSDSISGTEVCYVAVAVPAGGVDELSAPLFIFVMSGSRGNTVVSLLMIKAVVPEKQSRKITEFMLLQR